MYQDNQVNRDNRGPPGGGGLRRGPRTTWSRGFQGEEGEKGDSDDIQDLKKQIVSF